MMASALLQHLPHLDLASNKHGSLSPPYLADVPVPLRVPQPKQQLLTITYLVSSAATHTINRAINPPPLALQCTPAPLLVPTMHRRRRRGSAPSLQPVCSTNITPPYDQHTHGMAGHMMLLRSR